VSVEVQGLHVIFNDLRMASAAVNVGLGGRFRRHAGVGDVAVHGRGVSTMAIGALQELAVRVFGQKIGVHEDLVEYPQRG
jgi:hypothetical protein